MRRFRTIFESLLKHFQSAQSRIAWSVRIDLKSALGRHVFIGKCCRVHQSAIGDYSAVSENSTIYASKLSQHVTVGANSQIDKCNIASHVSLYENVQLNQCSIGPFSYVAASARMVQAKIGSFCSIGPLCFCGLGEHPVNWISTNPVFFSTIRQCGETYAELDHFHELAPISIGNDVWIGAHTYIRNGVTIGHGAVIASGAVVTKDVAPYSIVGGVPAKEIRKRFDAETIAKLLEIAWWDWPAEQLRKAQPYFVSDDIRAFIRDAEKLRGNA